MEGQTERQTDSYITISLRLLPVHKIRPVSVPYTSYKGDAGKPPAASSEWFSHFQRCGLKDKEIVSQFPEIYDKAQLKHYNYLNYDRTEKVKNICQIISGVLHALSISLTENV
jgi:hypothetical protein